MTHSMPTLRVALYLALITASTVMAAANPPGWYLVANHLHTSVGGDHSWHAGLSSLLDACDRMKIDFAIVTDHNTIDHWFFPEWKTVGHTTPIRGEEWTTPGGHAGLVGFSATSRNQAILPCWRPDSGIPCVNGQPNYQSMVTEVHRRNGLVIINHPKLARHVWPDDTFGADLVDVGWNLTDPVGSRGRGWWHDMMKRGVRIGAVGGSDWHYFLGQHEKDGLVPTSCGETQLASKGRLPMVPEIDKPINLVRSASKTPEGIIAALKRHNLIVLKDRSAARAFLAADADGDGQYDDAFEGDTAQAPLGSAVRFEARVLDGKGKTLRIIDRESVTDVNVNTNDFRHAFTRIRSDDHSFVRLEIGRVGECVGNPIRY
jgi:hypothetical protein